MGERERKRERETPFSFHLFMHSMVASYIGPDWRLNLQPWRIGTGLSVYVASSIGFLIIFKGIRGMETKTLRTAVVGNGDTRVNSHAFLIAVGQKMPYRRRTGSWGHRETPLQTWMEFFSCRFLKETEKGFLNQCFRPHLS